MSRSLSPHDYTPIEERTLCVCGRYKDKLHCPKCRSADTRGFARKIRVRGKDGSRITMRKYRCRRCGEAFNERQRTLCQAPALYGKPVIEFAATPAIGPQPSIEELFEQAQATDRLDAIRKQSR